MRRGLVLVAGVAVTLALLVAGCGAPPEYGLNYSAGDTFDFANGWSVKLQPGWKGLAVVSDGPEKVSPAFVPLRLYGPKGSVVDIQLETSRGSKSGLATYQHLIRKGDWDGDLVRTTYDGSDVTMTVTPEVDGTTKQLLVMFVGTGDDVLWVQVTDDPALDDAVRRGAPSADVARLVITSIGLSRSGN